MLRSFRLKVKYLEGEIWKIKKGGGSMVYGAVLGKGGEGSLTLLPFDFLIDSNRWSHPFDVCLNLLIMCKECWCV